MRVGVEGVEVERISSHQTKDWDGGPAEQRGGETAGHQEEEKSDWPHALGQLPACTLAHCRRPFRQSPHFSGSCEARF